MIINARALHKSSPVEVMLLVAGPCPRERTLSLPLHPALSTPQ